MARLIYAAMLALAMTCTGLAIGEPHRRPAKVKRVHKPDCKRTTWRYIGKERVRWDHDEDDHEWEEFDHTTDECVPPPC